jgi:predicted methyltransferase
VVTIELDPAAHEMCRQNPWSQPLFANEKITLRLGDSFEEIETFAPETFSVILHDPPAFQLAGELYSAEFYRRAFRVLKPRGRMFHYIGDPHSKSGARTTRGVVQRLQDAGFTRILPKPEAFGVLAYK